MHSPEQLLDQVERQFNEVAAHLAAGDVASLAVASAGLRALSVDLLRLQPQIRRSPERRRLVARVRLLVQGMQVVRENIARGVALVDQAVGVLVPGQPKSTYGVRSGVYGNALQQSGAFRVLSA